MKHIHACIGTCLLTLLPCAATAQKNHAKKNSEPRATLHQFINNAPYSLKLSVDNATYTIEPGKSIKLNKEIPNFPNKNIKLPKKDTFKFGYYDLVSFPEEKRASLDEETKKTIAEGIADFTAEEYATLSAEDKKLLRGKSVGLHLLGKDVSGAYDEIPAPGSSWAGSHERTKFSVDIFKSGNRLFLKYPSYKGAIPPLYHRATFFAYDLGSGPAPFDLIMDQDGNVKLEWLDL